MTTAYRSCLWLRKQGYLAEVVEHRAGKWRTDLFGIGDTIGLAPLVQPGEARNAGIVLVQAYIDTKANREKHAHLTLSHPKVLHWRTVGGRFVHHRWAKRKGKWAVTEEDI